MIMVDADELRFHGENPEPDGRVHIKAEMVLAIADALDKQWLDVETNPPPSNEELICCSIEHPEWGSYTAYYSPHYDKFTYDDGLPMFPIPTHYQKMPKGLTK